MKPFVPLALLAVLGFSFVPSVGAESASTDVCTTDIIESVSACVWRHGDLVCAGVYAPGPVYERCVPLSILDLGGVCVEPSRLIDAGMCLQREGDFVCLDGHWGHYPIRECVYVGPKAAASAGPAPYCLIGNPDCWGYLVCVWETDYTKDVCIRDPCDDTACWRAGPVPECVVIVPEGGDMGEKVCHDLSAECKVWYQRTTFIGTMTVCLVPPGGNGGDASDAPCADRYWETGYGPVRVVSRSSCEYEVYLFGKPVIGA